MIKTKYLSLSINTKSIKINSAKAEATQYKSIPTCVKDIVQLSELVSMQSLWNVFQISIFVNILAPFNYANVSAINEIG